MSACLLMMATGSAWAATNFGVRFQTNDNGAVLTVGNSLMSCPSGAANCAAARSGAIAGDDDDFNMTFVDADSIASTFDSSRSDLALPSGATVLWAGLYRGARTAAGSGGAAATGTAKTMMLQVPGAFRCIAS